MTRRFCLSINPGMLRRFAGVVFLSLAWGAQGVAPRPHIVLIVADDLGWMDTGVCAAYETGVPVSRQFYETPNIDRLAKSGVLFARAYATPLCSPSRASILTGREGPMFGFNNAEGLAASSKKTFAGRGLPAPAGWSAYDKIPPKRPDPRYPVAAPSTCMALPNGRPEENGFKVFCLPEMLPGYRCGFIGKWHVGGGNITGSRPQDFGFEAIAYQDEGWSDYTPKKGRSRWHRPGPETTADYLTDSLTELAVNWIQEQIRQQPDQPFFLQLAHFAVHDPLQAKPADIRYFEQKKSRGWNGQDNAVYAAMIKALDDSVGQIMETLDRLGIRENTLVCFLSDNGGVILKHDKVVTSNAPLRGRKATLWDGGIRIPMIASWPGNWKAGTVCKAFVDVTDLAPTLVAAAGLQPTAAIRRQWTGQSLLPLLDCSIQGKFVPRPLFFHNPFNRPMQLKPGQPAEVMPPQSAMIQNGYKLIMSHNGSLELYDLPDDPGETNNLYRAMPERANGMARVLMQWREKNIPDRYDTHLNPDYSPSVPGSMPFAVEGKGFTRQYEK